MNWIENIRKGEEEKEKIRQEAESREKKRNEDHFKDMKRIAEQNEPLMNAIKDYIRSRTAQLRGTSIDLRKTLDNPYFFEIKSGDYGDSFTVTLEDDGMFKVFFHKVGNPGDCKEFGIRPQQLTEKRVDGWIKWVAKKGDKRFPMSPTQTMSAWALSAAGVALVLWWILF